jgi:hypothetical protein
MKFNWKIRRTWPASWPKKFYEPDDPALDKLVVKFRKSYKSITAYHGCRLVSPESYYTHGLKLADHQELLERAVLFFCNLEKFSVTERQVRDAYKEIKENDVDDKKCYLALDDRELVKFCGHYLLYGSEFLISIGAGLQKETGIDYRQFLKKIGTPTIFVCDVPITLISDSDLRELTAKLGDASIENEECDVVNFSITLRSQLQATHIRRHFHPENVVDPYRFT